MEDSLVTSVFFNDTKRRPILAKHAAKVAHKQLRTLVRRKMPATVVL
jgi:hypothetical protein